MKQAYLILSHKNPKQLRELVKAIEHKDCFIFIHVDKKVELDGFLEQVPENDHTWYCADRIEVNWAGFSQILVTLKLMGMLITYNIPVTYVHLLSGQDFPLCTNDSIKKFFSQGNGKNFMDAFPLPRQGWGVNGGEDQYLLKWYVDEKGIELCQTDYRNNRLERRTFPEGFQPYGGSQWWSLHIDCIKYLYQACVEKNVLYDFYQHTEVPDEMFFQTVVMNSHLKNTVVTNNYRFVDWSNGNGHPVTLEKKHYFKLVESNCFFARKFDPDVDANVLMHLKTYRDKCTLRESLVNHA